MEELEIHEDDKVKNLFGIVNCPKCKNTNFVMTILRQNVKCINCDCEFIVEE